MRRAVLLAALVFACGGRSASTPTQPVAREAPAATYPADAAPEAAVPATSTTTASLPLPPSGRFLGANIDAAGGVTFRVWAPHATAAYVTGDFAADRIAMTSTGSGLFETRVETAHGGSIYRFALDTETSTFSRIDPYCRELRSGGCAVIDVRAPAAQTSTLKRPPLAASVVYELHVGSFNVPKGQTQGTFASARERLADLADLGVNVVELMPTNAFGGNATGWGYNPQLYFAPKSTYGSAADLRAFVDEAHRLGVAVWLDVVFNHYDGYKKAPLYCFDGYCPSGTAGIYFFEAGPWATTPWGPRPNFQAPEVSGMVVDAIHQWLVEYHGDGFRWDSVSNIRGDDGKGTAPGGRELLVRANAYAHKLGAISTAEDLKGYDALTEDPKLGGFGFDAQWDGFGWDVMDVLAQTSDDTRDLGRIDSALRRTYNGDPFAKVLFTETHDTVGNGGARLPSRIDAAAPNGWSARKRTLLGAVLLLTAPGVPMLFQGQELLATGTFTDPPVPLDWAALASNAKVRDAFRDLVRLRRNTNGGTGALAEPGFTVLQRNDTTKVLAFLRTGPSTEDVIVVLNLRNKDYARYDIGVPAAGPWRVRFNSDSTRYGDDFQDGQTGVIATLAQARDGQPHTLPLKLGAYGAIVLSK